MHTQNVSYILWNMTADWRWTLIGHEVLTPGTKCHTWSRLKSESSQILPCSLGFGEPWLRLLYFSAWQTMISWHGYKTHQNYFPQPHWVQVLAAQQIIAASFHWHTICCEVHFIIHIGQMQALRIMTNCQAE